MAKDKKWAVLKISGKQYLASEGSTLLVDKVAEPKAEVLLVGENDKIEIGTPVLKDAKITLKVVEPVVKGDKIRVYKYKSKSRYNKTRGFRAQYTKLTVEKIS